MDISNGFGDFGCEFIFSDQALTDFAKNDNSFGLLQKPLSCAALN